MPNYCYINSGANTEIGANTCANSLVEANLQAQRWNSTIGDWQGGSWIKGTQSGNVVTLSGVGVAPAAADFFTWWTLVDKNFPLPVTWLDFSANCERGNIAIKWSTATEQNSDYFLLERSTDGNNFSSIGTVPAAKNSSTVKNYSFTDTDPLSGTAFYRITEVDLNGNRQSTNSVAVSSCSSDNIFVYFAEGSIY
jgi:hypothetical protein